MFAFYKTIQEGERKTLNRATNYTCMNTIMAKRTETNVDLFQTKLSVFYQHKNTATFDKPPLIDTHNYVIL